MFRFGRALAALSLSATACMLPACVAIDDSSGAAIDEDASEEIASAESPLARTGGDRFWPNDNIVYCFAPAGLYSTVPEAWKPSIRSTLAEMARRLPVTFTEITCPFSPLPFQPHVVIALGLNGTGGVSDEIGYDGGAQVVTFYQDPNDPNAPPNAPTVMHEMLHVVGLFHEQSRSDRLDYVTINNSCINDSDEDQYETKPGQALTSGVYDYQSIMHYPTGQFCASSRPSSCNISDGMGGTFCATIVKKDGSPILFNSVMSREDINSVFYMYSNPFPTPASDDGASRAVAIGDFDGDGYSDVAVGLPLRTVDGMADAGEVRVYKGTSRGIYRWQTLTQSTANWATAEGGEFGRSLAAADIDNDGRSELIVGAPYLDVDGLDSAGAVAVFRPDDVGKLQVWRKYTQKTQGADVVRANARFGFAVAAGRIAQTYTSGSSGPTDPALTLVVGAPGTDGAGAVFLYSQTNPVSGSSVRRTQKLAPVAGGQFGSALAIGSVTANTTIDLVVGSPFNTHGQIDVFNGAAPVAASNLSAPIVTHFESVLGPDADTIGFGYSIAIGDFRGSSANDIAVGAPWTQNLKGAVYVYEYENLFADPNLFHRKQTLVQNSTPESGDVFGSSLAAANIVESTPQHELIVGAPGEDSNVGAISVFQGGAASLQGVKFLQQSDIPMQTNQAGARFGDVLAAGSINGLGDSGVTSDDFDAVQGQGIPDVVVGSPYAARFSLFWGDTALVLKGHQKY
ncbi:M12 family metallopeptidase [Sorangium sp. So ce590]|uniref:M12 family metallopeptidase n=1 Tax=Sorangium sp. So ce590 TaxID=3133317 RepID=UPI003F5E6E18